MRALYSTMAFLFVLVFTNCDKTSNGKQTTIIEQEECKPYFLFDRIEHYCRDIDENELWEIKDKVKKTEEENDILTLVFTLRRDTTADYESLKNIDRLGFTKTEVPSAQFEEIAEVFCERKHKAPAYSACVPIYRDILVFRKNNKLSGMAKICFECSISSIAGTNRNTEEFGQSGDYKKLYDLLYRQKASR
jgi:hypothetical protein